MTRSQVEHRPVAVMIITFRRHQLLAPLITAIRDEAQTVASTVRVVIVDNDPDRSAEPTAVEHGADYVNEPHPGIGAARRAALDAASDDELIVMMDDDVFPEPGWLSGLVTTWERYRPTVVMGFIRYLWPEAADPWFAAGGFMRRDHHPTGTRLTALATGNVLLDTREVRRLGVNFDPAQGLSGGEDSLFGEALLKAGGTIVASADSVASDRVPVERTSVAFVRRRTIAHGASYVSIGLRNAVGARSFALRVATVLGALVRAFVFYAAHVFGRMTGDLHRNAVGKRRFWFALGRLRGAFGHRVAEYARSED